MPAAKIPGRMVFTGFRAKLLRSKSRFLAPTPEKREKMIRKIVREKSGVDARAQVTKAGSRA
jgi:hypothetical protein